MNKLQLRLDPDEAKLLVSALTELVESDITPGQRQRATLMKARLEFRAVGLWGIGLHGTDPSEHVLVPSNNWRPDTEVHQVPQK